MASLDEVLNNATSDEVEIDFSSAVEFENLPDGGPYVFEIEECEPGVSGESAKNPGAPLLVWRFAVAEGEHTGRLMFRHSPTNGKGSGLTKDVLKALGVGGLDNPQVKFKRSTAIGQRVLADVRLQKGQPEGGYQEMVNIRPYVAPSGAAAL